MALAAELTPDFRGTTTLETDVLLTMGTIEAVRVIVRPLTDEKLRNSMNGHLFA